MSSRARSHVLLNRHSVHLVVALHRPVSEFILYDSLCEAGQCLIVGFRSIISFAFCLHPSLLTCDGGRLSLIVFHVLIWQLIFVAPAEGSS